MVDITRDEFWEKDHQEKNKENFIKKTVAKNKFLSISFFIFGICVVVNTILIYSFFKILNNL